MKVAGCKDTLVSQLLLLAEQPEAYVLAEEQAHGHHHSIHTNEKSMKAAHIWEAYSDVNAVLDCIDPSSPLPKQHFRCLGAVAVLWQPARGVWGLQWLRLQAGLSIFIRLPLQTRSDEACGWHVSAALQRRIAAFNSVKCIIRNTGHYRCIMQW